MAITRARKEELLAEYRQQLEESTGVVMADYSALTVPQLEDVRRQAREQEGEIFVVKNTLFRIAMQERGAEMSEELATGATIVAFCHQDVPPLAKLFRDFAREVDDERFRVKGGFMDDRILTREEALAIADLPSREELLAQVLRGINAPASQLVGVMSSGIRQIMNVLQAYVTKMEEGEGAPAEAAA